MAQTVSGPVPSDPEAYFSALGAIEGMTSESTDWFGNKVTTNLYQVAPDNPLAPTLWTVTFPDDVDTVAVSQVVNPSTQTTSTRSSKSTSSSS